MQRCVGAGFVVVKSSAVKSSAVKSSVVKLFTGLFCLVLLTMIGFSAWAVDVNQASAGQLQQVKGIGAKTAQRIVAERARGPFESLEHLSERLSGIGPKTIVKLKAAGLCAGTPQKPCAHSQPPSPAKGTALPARARAGAGSGLGVGLDAVTPELIELP